MKFPRVLTAIAAALSLASCGAPAGNPVSQEERRLAAEQHPQLLAEFGGAYAGDEAPYLARLGDKLAAEAGLKGQCTFTLVNSDVVNAFAVPGCYIYVTRGLLAIVNSEAELASVLAHELGHIAADHSERQEKRSVWRSLGVLAVSTITGSPDLSRIASAAASYFTLRYSRKHEYEADDLGLRYLSEAGYDPFAAADMLAALQRQDAFRASLRGGKDASSIPEWALTHPLTENRIARARKAAEKSGHGPDDLPEFEARYLGTVDGLLYADDPQQGFVLGRRFAHPVMRIAFEAPPGFTLTNSPQAIMLEGPDGVRGEFSGGELPPGGLPDYAEAILSRMLGRVQFEIVASEPFRAHGVPALFVEARVATRDGPVPLSLAAYAGEGRSAYHFLMVSSPGAGVDRTVGQLFQSFAFLTPAEVASLRPRRIHVVTVGAGDTAQGLAARMASERPLEHFLMLNGLDRPEALRKGRQVKLVEWAR